MSLFLILQSFLLPQTWTAYEALSAEPSYRPSGAYSVTDGRRTLPELIEQSKKAGVPDLQFSYKLEGLQLEYEVALRLEWRI